MSRRSEAKQAFPPASCRAEPHALEPLRLLEPDGSLCAGAGTELSDEQLLQALRLMLLSRRVDERGFSLQRQGRMGTFSTVAGQEASVIGPAMALDPARDWICPQYRELPAMLRQGFPLAGFFRYFMGDPAGNAIPPAVNLLPFQISLATQIPHAVGLAWGLRHQDRDGVVLVYFGDGASSEGDAHEAMNLAGVRGAPVIFLLQNNGWAISTPVSSQTAAPSFALRAPGYGFPGLLVDGNDLLAMHAATAWAVERARSGAGPTLIEARTYRMGPHNTADDPTRYVPAAELEAHRPLDPLERMRAHLTARGLLDDAAEQEMAEAVAREVDAAVEEAERELGSGPGLLFEHVFAEPTPRLQAQRDAMERAR